MLFLFLINVLQEEILNMGPESKKMSPCLRTLSLKNRILIEIQLYSCSSNKLVPIHIALKVMKIANYWASSENMSNF